MDNTARFYAAEFRRAFDLLHQGQRLKALEICWDLRNDPQIGLYRRARVNLFLAINTVYKEHPDKAKFAHEAIALSAQVRQHFAPLSERDELEIQSIEKSARERLVIIEDEKFFWDMVKGVKSREEFWRKREELLAVIEERKKQRELNNAAVSLDAGQKDEGPGTAVSSSGVEMSDVESTKEDLTDAPVASVEDELDLFTIEGMYTDSGTGQLSEKTVKVETEAARKGETQDRGKSVAKEMGEMTTASEISLPGFDGGRKGVPGLNLPFRSKGGGKRTGAGPETPPLSSPVTTPPASSPKSPMKSLIKTEFLSLRSAKENQQKKSTEILGQPQQRQMTYSEALMKDAGDKEEEKTSDSRASI